MSHLNRSGSSGGNDHRLPTTMSVTPPAVGYPEAFYAHTHRTPERSNRQKRTITPATEPLTPESRSNSEDRKSRRPHGRPVGRLRPQQLNLFHGSNNQNNSLHQATSDNPNTPTIHIQSSTSNSSNGQGNVCNGFSHIQQQIIRQQQPQSPPAVHAGAGLQPDISSNRSVASASNASQATLAAKIPSSHVNIITSAYGKHADIYRDILQIPPSMTSEREIRIAYFRRGRQVLAEKPDETATLGGNINVSQMAKMKFQAVSMAYEILCNKSWKESYDMYGLYGPDAFQEPEGTSVLLAEDASLAEPRQVPFDKERSPVDRLYNLRCTSASPTSSTSTARTAKARTKKAPVISFQMEPPSDKPTTNGMNDNASCISQSTTGTGTSSGVLRKTGSFLEKLNRQKARIRKMKARQDAASNDNNGEIAADEDYELPQSTTVTWNEEVEELIFRQDPDEISFKAGTSFHPIVEEEPSVESSARQTPQSLQQQQPEQQQLGNTPINNVRSNYQHDGGRGFVPSGINLNQAASRSTNQGNSPSSKRRVVLDTAELGTHLEKLDKVADSIADIFDELEASFDGLLGGGPEGQNRAAMAMNHSKLMARQQAIASAVPAVPPLLPPPSHYQSSNQPAHNTPRLPPQQAMPQQTSQSPHNPSHQPPEHTNRLTGFPASPYVQAAPSSNAPRSQFEDASYQTPPATIGSNHRDAGMHGVQEQPERSTPPKPTKEEQEEAIRVEEQAMALMREISAIESSPLKNVVIKTKKNKHQHHRKMSSLSDAAMVAEEGDGQSQHQKQTADFGEAASTCASDMAAGGENNTVATSVVSLLDPQQHTNAPLKPAASTEITGAKASRKRLKNVQRRRQQQQRAKEQQQQQSYQQAPHQSVFQHNNQENLFDLVDPFEVLGSPIKSTIDKAAILSLKDSANQINQMTESSILESNDKKANKKQAEDLYFESLYNNFFLLPKERLPNEMTVRTKPNKSDGSVSTLSHSVSTLHESSKLDFNPWDLANGALTQLGDNTPEGRERRSKRHREVMKRVDELLSQRSASNLDGTIDSSFREYGLDTTYDSGTFLDTTFDSTAVDTAFESVLDLPRKDRRFDGGDMAAMISGCNEHPGAAFLNNVFDVPLEAPLEFLCGQAKDCASSVKPRRRKKVEQQKKKRSSNKPKPSRVEKDDVSSVESTDSSDSVVLHEEDLQHEIEAEEEEEPPTDESITLLDPPTHDSRINRCDDSTLYTLNTNNEEYSGGTTEQVKPSEPPSRRDPDAAGTTPADKTVTRVQDDPSAVNAKDTTASVTSGSIASQKQRDDVGSVESQKHKDGALVPDDQSRESPLLRLVETASESQFVQIAASRASSQDEGLETASPSNVSAAVFDKIEEREGNSSSPRPQSIQSFNSDNGSNTLDSDDLPSPTSLSGRRQGFNRTASNVSKEDYHVEIQEDGNESTATSVAGSSVVSSEKAQSTILGHMLGYIKKATDQNPSLASVKANLQCGMETWQASNDACMDAIVIPDDDMGAMLSVIAKEMERPTPSWMPRPE